MTTLITGGSGFLGRGIMYFMPGEDYIVYSRDEYKQDLCKRKFPDAEYVLGDVKDRELLEFTLERFRVDTIIHTAAIKYIPEAELNTIECINVNIDGSRNVVAAASVVGVARVVGISTDKAVQPVNTYGASKMIMERIFGEYAAYCRNTIYTLTRYGNVVGSTGSVIPLFIHQFEEQGRVTLTDPLMTRFWISISDAVDLIRLALKAPNGSMIVPNAKAMTMGDLAQTLGRRTGESFKIDVVGPRPGEKKHESMLHTYESVRAERFNDGGYYVIKPLGCKTASEEFTLVSNQPDMWLDAETMNQYIEEANLL